MSFGNDEFRLQHEKSALIKQMMPNLIDKFYYNNFPWLIILKSERNYRLQKDFLQINGTMK